MFSHYFDTNEGEGDSVKDEIISKSQWYHENAENPIRQPASHLNDNHHIQCSKSENARKGCDSESVGLEPKSVGAVCFFLRQGRDVRVSHPSDPPVCTDLVKARESFVAAVFTLSSELIALLPCSFPRPFSLILFSFIWSWFNSIHFCGLWLSVLLRSAPSRVSHNEEVRRSQTCVFAAE